MNPYVSLAEEMHIDSMVVSCMRGAVPVPRFTYSSDVVGLGFPPVIVPVWSIDTWPGYVGVARHWFGNDAGTSYVQYFCESQKIVEVARTASQFFVWLAYEFFCNVPDDDEVGAFVEAVGVCARADVRKYFAGVRVVEDLVKLDVFSGDPPMVLRDYGGVLPWVSRCSMSAVKEAIDRHLWTDLWFLINSPGWDEDAVRLALGVLSKENVDVRFQDCIRAWRWANLPGGPWLAAP